MSIPSERQIIREASERLCDLLDAPYDPSAVNLEVRLRDKIADAIVTVGSRAFIIESKRSAALGTIARAIHQLEIMTQISKRPLIPIIAVPYMGKSGREYCERAGIGWLDLSGNAKITAPGLRVHIFGYPNRFRRRGRPESAFGPRGSRIARWLLMNPGASIRQNQLASATGLNEGYTSRVVGKLIQSGLAYRDADGIRVRDFDLLLDAWHDEYRFDRHTLMRGHIPSASGDRLYRTIAQTLDELREPYAMTGLSAAWHLTRYAGFRISTVYLEDTPSAKLLGALRFREEARGSNVWLVVPNDEGVFHGAIREFGVRCVHPVQVYLDLKGHPERASEAADEIRDEFLQP